MDLQRVAPHDGRVEKRPRGRPSIPSEQQRQRLLAAAGRVLLRRDIESASVKEIVREAGMSSRSFYEVFQSKDELILELVEVTSRLFFARVASTFQADLPPEQIVDALLESYLQVLVPVVAMDRTRIGAKTWEQVEAMRRSYLTRLIDLGLAWMEQAHRRRVIAKVPDRATAELVLLGIEGLTLWYGRESRDEAFAAARPAIRRLMLGLIGISGSPEGGSG